MKLYVEGGGDAAILKTACREGFSKFLERAGLAAHMPRIVACGSRQNAFDSFSTALRCGERALLLVDSEAPVAFANQLGDASKAEDRAQWLPWQHLRQPQGDGWLKPENAEDLQCHLMVQCMESWLLVDRTTLKAFSGRGSKKIRCQRRPTLLSVLPRRRFMHPWITQPVPARRKGSTARGNIPLSCLR